ARCPRSLIPLGSDRSPCPPARTVLSIAVGAGRESLIIIPPSHPTEAACGEGVESAGGQRGSDVQRGGESDATTRVAAHGTGDRHAAHRRGGPTRKRGRDPAGRPRPGSPHHGPPSLRLSGGPPGVPEPLRQARGHR